MATASGYSVRQSALIGPLPPQYQQLRAAGIARGSYGRHSALSQPCPPVGRKYGIAAVTKMLAMALLLQEGLLGGVWGEAAGVDGSGGVLGPSRLQRRASSLLQGPVSLLTSSIYACVVPSHVARACARSG